MRSPQTEIEDMAEGCRFTHLTFSAEGIGLFDIEELVIESPGLLENFPGDKSLAAAALTVNGLTSLDIPLPSFDMNLVYTTDPDALTAKLETFSLDAGELGRLRLFGRFSNFDNDTDDPIFVSGDPSVIHEIGLALDDNGLLARMLEPYGASLEGDKIEMATAIRSIPETLLPMASAEAIVRFATALPDPRGRWTFHFESAEGLAMTSFSEAATLEQWLTLVPEDAAITVSASARP